MQHKEITPITKKILFLLFQASLFFIFRYSQYVNQKIKIIFACLKHWKFKRWKNLAL